MMPDRLGQHDRKIRTARTMRFAAITENPVLGMTSSSDYIEAENAQNPFGNWRVF
jgi:hypothetical protein